MVLFIIIAAFMLLTAIYYHSCALGLLRSTVPPQLRSEISIISNMKDLLNEDYAPKKARYYHEMSKKIAVSSLLPISVFCATANQLFPAAVILLLLLVYAVRNAPSG